MTGGKTPLGYTIIEVMIVLAVSGVMFTIAASFISGKQERTAFMTGTNEMAAQLQDTIEQVTDGQYSDIPFNCTASGTTLTIKSGVPGTDSGCVFLGKLLYFEQGKSPSNYDVFTLAGLRTDSAGNPISDVTAAHATPVVSSDRTVDLTNLTTIPQGLEVQSLTVDDAPSAGFGLVQSFAAVNANNQYAAGGQSIELIKIKAPGLAKDTGGSPAQDETNAVAAIVSGGIATAQSATICITDGQHYATITLGDSSSFADKLSATVQAGLATC